MPTCRSRGVLESGPKLAVHAGKRVGIAVGSGTWGGCGMITAFVLGTAVFGGRGSSVENSIAGIATLSLGLLLVSLSKGEIEIELEIAIKIATVIEIEIKRMQVLRASL